MGAPGHNAEAAPSTGVVACAPTPPPHPSSRRAQNSSRAPQFTPARAPRLRRIAELIDRQAEELNSPVNARALACQMRLRASELEAGTEPSDEEEMARLLAEMSGEEPGE